MSDNSFFNLETKEGEEKGVMVNRFNIIYGKFYYKKGPTKLTIVSEGLPNGGFECVDRSQKKNTTVEIPDSVLSLKSHVLNSIKPDKSTLNKDRGVDLKFKIYGYRIVSRFL